MPLRPVQASNNTNLIFRQTRHTWIRTQSCRLSPQTHETIWCLKVQSRLQFISVHLTTINMFNIKTRWVTPCSMLLQFSLLKINFLLFFLVGHGYQRAEAGDQNFPRHLHRAAGFSKNSRNVRQNDQAGQRWRRNSGLNWYSCRGFSFLLTFEIHHFLSAVLEHCFFPSLYWFPALYFIPSLYWFPALYIYISFPVSTGSLFYISFPVSTGSLFYISFPVSTGTLLYISFPVSTGYLLYISFPVSTGSLLYISFWVSTGTRLYISFPVSTGYLLYISFPVSTGSLLYISFWVSTGTLLYISFPVSTDSLLYIAFPVCTGSLLYISFESGSRHATPVLYYVPQKLVNDTFQNMWFTPVRDKDNKRLLQKVMNITDVVAACHNSGFDWLEQLMDNVSYTIAWFVRRHWEQCFQIWYTSDYLAIQCNYGLHQCITRDSVLPTAVTAGLLR